MSYSDKLKDPRWQKKRLKIMERDNWKCYNCDDEESTLNIHHKKYIKGRDPWEYPDKLLVTVCEKCHKEIVIFERTINSGMIIVYYDFKSFVVSFLKLVMRKITGKNQNWVL